jgi:hypothetical protein
MNTIEYKNWLEEMDEEIDYSKIQKAVTVDVTVEAEYLFDNGDCPF